MIPRLTKTIILGLIVIILVIELGLCVNSENEDQGKSHKRGKKRRRGVVRGALHRIGKIFHPKRPKPSQQEQNDLGGGDRAVEGGSSSHHGASED